MANYPTSASTDANLYVAVNNLRTQLNGAINNSVTTITVDSTTGFPTAGLISIESEVVAYTGTNATQFTGCTRGSDGTSAASHADDVFVSLRIVAAHHNNPKDEIIAVETDLVAAHGTLSDVATPASTAADVKTRLDHIVSELKRITQNTNWYDAVAAGLADIAGNTFVGVGRNRVINGGMTIDQRNVGGLVTINSGTSVYGVDRFSAAGTAASGVFKTQRLTTTPPTGFTHYTHVTVTTADASIAAGDIYAFTTFIEGTSVRDFLFGGSSAKTVTLSFYVRSNLTGTFSGGFRNSGVSRSYPFTYSISAANTWERKTVTFVGDTSGTWLTDFGVGLILTFDLGTGSTFQGTANAWASNNSFAVAGSQQVITSTSNTWDITGVQMEIGSVATPFEFVSMPLLLLQCQRYYEKSYDIDVAPAASTTVNLTRATAAVLATNTPETGSIYYKVTKRAAPSVVLYNQTGTSGQWNWLSSATVNTSRVTSINGIGTNSFDVFQAVTSADLWAQGHWTADADF